MTEDAFWGLSLPLFVRLWERHKERERKADRRSGEVVAMVYNMGRDTKRDPKGWSWLNVYPEHKPPVRPQTEDEMLLAMTMLWRAGGEEQGA